MAKVVVVVVVVVKVNSRLCQTSEKKKEEEEEGAEGCAKRVSGRRARNGKAMESRKEGGKKEVAVMVCCLSSIMHQE